MCDKFGCAQHQILVTVCIIQKLGITMLFKKHEISLVATFGRCLRRFHCAECYFVHYVKILTGHLKAFSTSVLNNPASVNFGTWEENLEIMVNCFTWLWLLFIFPLERRILLTFIWRQTKIGAFSLKVHCFVVVLLSYVCVLPLFRPYVHFNIISLSLFPFCSFIFVAYIFSSSFEQKIWGVSKAIIPASLL